MRLGIDFGTTRTVAAAVDRGNYPLLPFEDLEGAAVDWFPSLVAIRGPERRYGWQAWACQQDPSWTVIRSIKRILQDAGPTTVIELADQRIPLFQLLCEMVAALRSLLPKRRLEVMLGIPANAHSNQRFLTVEAFRSAALEVIGLLNEPSAASIELGHKTKIKGTVLVYDLGGGTFDASLVEMGDKAHRVIATEGIPTLGGDDFDAILAELAVEPAKRETLSQSENFRLLEECRIRKEALNANTRRIVLDLETVREGWGTVTVQAADFYERCRPLIEETLHVVDDLLESRSSGTIEALYVTGGGSELPVVGRVLRERFGRRVHRSLYARSATAIGLAIQADRQTGYVLKEKFTRYFGVWREGDKGSRILFDPLFSKGTSLPSPGEQPLVIQRDYNPVHNLGHFRYLECSQLDDSGQPAGDVTMWDEIVFPFDPEVKETNGVAVEHSGAAPSQHIEERYSSDASGTVTVTISNMTAGYERKYELGRWASKDTVVSPPKTPHGNEKRKAVAEEPVGRRSK